MEDSSRCANKPEDKSGDFWSKPDLDFPGMHPRLDPVFDPKRSNTRLPPELTARILQIQNPDPKHQAIAMYRLTLVIESMMIRMINQLRQGSRARSPVLNKLYFLKRIPMQDLLTASYPALYDAARRFEIRDRQSVYSFPRYLKTLIARELYHQFRQAACTKRDSDYSHETLTLNHDRQHAAAMVADILEAAARDKILTPRQWQAIQLQLKGYTYQEIAREMGVTRTVVDHLITRAHARMRKLIKKEGVI